MFLIILWDGARGDLAVAAVYAPGNCGARMLKAGYLSLSAMPSLSRPCHLYHAHAMSIMSTPLQSRPSQRFHYSPSTRREESERRRRSRGGSKSESIRRSLWHLFLHTHQPLECNQQRKSISRICLVVCQMFHRTECLKIMMISICTLWKRETVSST